jgi:alpha-tubulin suppressor-like RCC1 family protein
MNGSNNLGQLRLGHASEMPEPTELRNKFGKISSIACSSQSTFIFTNSGDIFACGWNSYGILGLGDTMNRTESQKLPRKFTPKIFAVCDFSEKN